jgi:hypothetical protein
VAALGTDLDPGLRRDDLQGLATLQVT